MRGLSLKTLSKLNFHRDFLSFKRSLIKPALAKNLKLKRNYLAPGPAPKTKTPQKMLGVGGKFPKASVLSWKFSTAAALEGITVGGLWEVS